MSSWVSHYVAVLTTNRKTFRGPRYSVVGVAKRSVAFEGDGFLAHRVERL